MLHYIMRGLVLSFALWRNTVAYKKDVDRKVREHVMFHVIMGRMNEAVDKWRQYSRESIAHATKMWAVGTKLVYNKQGIF